MQLSAAAIQLEVTVDKYGHNSPIEPWPPQGVLRAANTHLSS